MIVWSLLKTPAARIIADGWKKELSEGKSIDEVCRPGPLNNDYSKIRERILSIFDGREFSRRDAFDYDMSVGLPLFDYFKNELGMTDSDACDDDCWRYLQVCVVPDIVGKRWNTDTINDKRMWSYPQRFYLKTLWWHSRIIWAGSVEETLSHCGNRYDISQLTDRPNRDIGWDVDVIREIIYHFSSLDSERVYKELFSQLMMLNNSRSSTIEPLFFNGSIKGYVDQLFSDVMGD